MLCVFQTESMYIIYYTYKKINCAFAKIPTTLYAPKLHAQKRKLKAFSPASATRPDLELIQQIQRDGIYSVRFQRVSSRFASGHLLTNERWVSSRETLRRQPDTLDISRHPRKRGAERRRTETRWFRWILPSIG